MQEHFAFFSADGMDGEPREKARRCARCWFSASSQTGEAGDFVADTLEAGIPETNLEQMQLLLSGGKPGTKVKDINVKVQPDYLSEDEGAADAAGQDEYGLEHDASPLEKSVQKLTAIMEILTEERKKKASGSSLDHALDGSYGGSSEGGLHTLRFGEACGQRRSTRWWNG